MASFASGLFAMMRLEAPRIPRTANQMALIQHIAYPLGRGGQSPAGTCCKRAAPRGHRVFRAPAAMSSGPELLWPRGGGALPGFTSRVGCEVEESPSLLGRRHVARVVAAEEAVTSLGARPVEAVEN